MILVSLWVLIQSKDLWFMEKLNDNPINYNKKY